MLDPITTSFQQFFSNQITIIPFIHMRNGDSERLRNMPEVTQHRVTEQGFKLRILTTRLPGILIKME